MRVLAPLIILLFDTINTKLIKASFPTTYLSDHEVCVINLNDYINFFNTTNLFIYPDEPNLSDSTIIQPFQPAGDPIILNDKYECYISKSKNQIGSISLCKGNQIIFIYEYSIFKSLDLQKSLENWYPSNSKKTYQFTCTDLELMTSQTAIVLCSIYEQNNSSSTENDENEENIFLKIEFVVIDLMSFQPSSHLSYDINETTYDNKVNYICSMLPTSSSLEDPENLIFTIFSKRITIQYNMAHVKISKNETTLEVYPFNLDVKNSLAVLDAHKINQNHSNSTLYFTLAKYTQNSTLAIYQTNYSISSHLATLFKYIEADAAFFLDSGGLQINFESDIMHIEGGQFFNKGPTALDFDSHLINLRFNISNIEYTSTQITYNEFMASIIFRNNSDLAAYVAIDLVSKNGNLKIFDDPSTAPNTGSYADNSLFEIYPGSVKYYENGQPIIYFSTKKYGLGFFQNVYNFESNPPNGSQKNKVVYQWSVSGHIVSETYLVANQLSKKQTYFQGFGGGKLAFSYQEMIGFNIDISQGNYQDYFTINTERTAGFSILCKNSPVGKW